MVERGLRKMIRAPPLEAGVLFYSIYTSSKPKAGHMKHKFLMDFMTTVDNAEQIRRLQNVK
jgi:hypothetical protein